MELKIYNTKLEVAKHFCHYLKNLSATHDNLHIALSGGSTPKIVFDELASHFKKAINWSKIHLYWGDERCVPPTDAQSNHKMTVDHLLSKIAFPANNIHRIKGENSPEEEAERYGALLDRELPRSRDIPQFDLVILGMGDDGHTASIFPHQVQLWDSSANCEVATHPESGQHRVTLTGKVINNAKEVAFLVTGSSKSKKVREIIHHEGAFKSYPASLVAPENGRVLWFLDKDSAKEINPD